MRLQIRTSVSEDVDEVPCEECQTGVMRLSLLTYYTWLKDDFITVPNFPAWVCDICGYREYDGRALDWLQGLLKHFIVRPTGREARAGRDAPQAPSARL
ncbi:MAG: YgiT-type zinc finger protein [Chloroflexota bacterium]